ncbi:ATP-binding protein [Xylophilus sp. GOD-11R]|uniref:hybrid sensor histidine kinase/response regulator n=1 Tax=Xylophilus sp. GOD-11R TaxID=3089814 RepID=UPI00298CBC68|nr:ATP-binding protein [Xylophilus sp. GOD-11R]WPB57302.1 ATP-binding protein [Xylophilus sp. GOD-11R]
MPPSKLSSGAGPGPAPIVPDVLVWYGAADGSLLVPNAHWETFTGQTGEQYGGWGWLAAVHESDREDLRDLWRAGIEAGIAFALDYRLRRHDGTWRQVRAQAAPVHHCGVLRQWVGFLIDRTDSLQAARALEASEARLRILDDIGHATRPLRDPDDIMATTARLLGQHLGATRCAYADVEPDGDRFTIRHDWAQAGAPSSAGVYSLDLFGPMASSQMRCGVPLVIEDVDREVDEESSRRMFAVIDVKAIICAGLVKDGRLVAMMAVHQATPRRWTPDELQTVSDVVERCWAHIERTRDAALLREQDTRKDEFIATLAHELRNPLAPIKYAVMLASKGAVAPGLERRLGIIDRQVSVMARLIDDLLDVSRINRGLIELHREDTDLATLVDSAVEAAGALIESQQHRIEVDVPRGIVVNVDPTRLAQIIGNLLTNAAKYTPVGGRIQVEAEARDGQARLVVRDNGLGIQASDLPRLFQMFSQLRTTTSHAQGGLGLGLALVRKLVELHGGTVSAASPGLDKGSSFTVELPLSTRAGPGALLLPPAASSSTTPTKPTTRPRRILVVEDNDDGRETLVELFQSLGHDVHSSADGQSGLALALETAPDLVLLDLGLPGMNGVQVATALRRLFPPQRMGLMALTGWGAAADVARTRAAGFDRHLTKPVEVDVLLRAVEEVLVDVASSD